MNINRKVLSMALGGATLPWGLATANDSLSAPKPLSSVGRIGDLSDQDRPATPSTYRNASYAAQEPQYGESIVMEQPMYDSSSDYSTGCSTSCSDGGCDSLGCGKVMGCGLSNMLGWGEVEALLWWAPHTQTPPLVATVRPVNKLPTSFSADSMLPWRRTHARSPRQLRFLVG